MAEDLDFDVHEGSTNIFQSLPDEEKDSVQKVTVLSEAEANNFKPMLWPMMDDGKEKRTNAIGYPVGGWYQDQKAKIEQIKAQKEQEAEQKEQAALEAARLQEEQQQKEEELTVAKLEQIQKDAYAEGLKNGQHDGYQQGLDQGLKEGHEQGFNQGQDEGMKKGYDEGFARGQEEGFFKGQEQGLKNADDMVSAQINRFRVLADNLANPMRQVDGDVTDELVYLVSRLCSVLLKHEIKTDPCFIKETIVKAIAVLPNGEKGADIYLNEDDLNLVTTLVGSEYIKAQHWNLIADNNLALGDVLVKNELSSVNWKLNDRIDELLNNFLIESQSAIDSASREYLEGYPDYDELKKESLAPKPEITAPVSDIAPNIETPTVDTSDLKSNTQANPVSK